MNTPYQTPGMTPPEPRALLTQLVACHGTPGEEGEVAALLSRICAPYVTDMGCDSFGNFIAHLGGGGPRVMLCAHMDTPGLAVTAVDEQGYVRFAPLGQKNSPPPGTPVLLQNGRRGVIASEKTAAAEGATQSASYIDIGTQSAEETRSLVSTGLRAVPFGEPVFFERRVLAPQLHNRLGCAALVLTLALLSARRAQRRVSPDYDVYFVFTAQESLGGRGAGIAARALSPTYVLGVDVAPTDDGAGAAAPSLRLGGGPALKLMDQNYVAHAAVVSWLRAAASRLNVPLQADTVSGIRETRTLHSEAGGLRTGGLSLPVRHLDTPLGLMDRGDLDACVQVLIAALEIEG